MKLSEKLRNEVGNLHYYFDDGSYSDVISDIKRLEDKVEVLELALEESCVRIAQLNIHGQMVTITEDVMPSRWIDLARQEIKKREGEADEKHK